MMSQEGGKSLRLASSGFEITTPNMLICSDCVLMFSQGQ